jgi:hypothetical protein
MVPVTLNDPYESSTEGEAPRGGSYSDCVGGTTLYLLQHLRLRGGVCKAVLTVVVQVEVCVMVDVGLPFGIASPLK